MFLHGGLLHIGSNMLYLFIFGDNVEDRLGHFRFLIFYFVCGVVAGITHIVVNAELGRPEHRRIGRHRRRPGRLLAAVPARPGTHAAVHRPVHPGPAHRRRVPDHVLVRDPVPVRHHCRSGATTEQTSGVAVWAHIGGFIGGLILLEIMRPARRAPVLSY